MSIETKIILTAVTLIGLGTGMLVVVLLEKGRRWIMDKLDKGNEQVIKE